MATKEKKTKKEKVVSTTLDILSTEPIERFTFSYIAKKAGVSRSCIVNYFPKKQDLEKYLKPVVYESIESYLNFSSIDQFISSWEKMINENKSLIHLMMSDSDIIRPEEINARLLAKIPGDPTDVELAVYYAIGYALANSNQ